MQTPCRNANFPIGGVLGSRIRRFAGDRDSLRISGRRIRRRFWRGFRFLLCLRHPDRQAIAATRDTFRQPEYYPFELNTQEKTLEKLNYLRENPVRKALFRQTTDEKWRSARWYEWRDSLASRFFEGSPGISLAWQSHTD
jgi:hypothetical protein